MIDGTIVTRLFQATRNQSVTLRDFAVPDMTGRWHLQHLHTDFIRFHQMCHPKSELNTRMSCKVSALKQLFTTDLLIVMEVNSSDLNPCVPLMFCAYIEFLKLP